MESGVGYKTEAGQEFWEGAVSAGMDWTGVGVLIEFRSWKIVNCRFGRDIWLLFGVNSKIQG